MSGPLTLVVKNAMLRDISGLALLATIPFAVIRSMQQEQEATRAKRYNTYLRKMEGNRILFRTSYRTTHKSMVGQVEVGRNWLHQISAAPIFEENHESTCLGPHYFAQKPPCTSQIK